MIMLFHCSTDYCVELTVMDEFENLCQNCYIFTLKWFQLNSFEETYFLENYKKKKKERK